jgi:hypothetical protein
LKPRVQFLLPLLAIALAACSPTSLEEYHYEGENIAKEIALELTKVHSEKDLFRLAPKLKKKFSLMVDLMVAARKCQKRSEEDFYHGSEEASDLLKEELIRIYEIDGCQETLEEMQREALHRLDLLT